MGGWLLEHEGGVSTRAKSPYNVKRTAGISQSFLISTSVKDLLPQPIPALVNILKFSLF